MDEIAFAAGATLSAMLGLMQWRVDRPAGRVSGYLLLWVLGFVWTFGNFLRGTLAMAGASADSASALFAENFAWSCTLLGPIAIGRLLQGAMGTSRASRRFMAFTIGVSLLNLVMLVQATRAHDYHLDASAYPTASFYVGLLVGTIALLIFRAHRKANSQPRQMPRWFAPAALLFAAIHTSAILLSMLVPNLPEYLLATAGLIGRHWTIPWSVLIAVSLAQAHYADVILKRSLWLLGSVALATLISTQFAGVAAGLPLVITTLGLAALMLAAPYFRRALDTLVDKGILERPDYPEASKAVDLAFRRATDRAQLIGAALESLRATLRVDARWIESERQLDIAVSHQARTLMQQELAFLESVRTQLEHRLDAMHFETEQRALSLREERLKRLLTEAELKALRTQVDPHFLFNTLNTIADLISTHPGQAERMTVRLAECFRYALATHSRNLSTLDEELNFARHYLEIEQVRFGDRLRVEISRGDALGTEAIPSLLLQPLLENAIRHGLSPVREGGCVSVRAHREGERLRLSVEDDGVGLRPGFDSRTGIGLRNVQDRLRTLYEQAAEFLIADRPGGRGTAVTIVIPLHAH
jgi:two-component sensor histidine kinase